MSAEPEQTYEEFCQTIAPVSEFVCSAYGDTFTSCPPAAEEQWGTECLADNCPSHEPMRYPTLVSWTRDEVPA